MGPPQSGRRSLVGIAAASPRRFGKGAAVVGSRIMGRRKQVPRVRGTKLASGRHELCASGLRMPEPLKFMHGCFAGYNDPVDGTICPIGVTD